MGNRECVICGLFYSALEWSTHRSGLELAVHVSALWCLLLGTMEILRPVCLLKTGDERTWAFWRQLGSYTVCSKLLGESKRRMKELMLSCRHEAIFCYWYTCFLIPQNED